MFENYQNTDIWRTRLNTLIEIYEKHQALSIFAQGLTRSIPMLMTPTQPV
ncbi:MAG: hypothetical protein J7647_04030 [Cyanobacteria bacterium SBLK]|nr:hypothetical protein [Cyanobacteria bacterium SBLK]